MKCSACGRYTLSRNACPECGGRVISAHPHHFPESERMLELIVRERKARRRLESHSQQDG